MATANSMADGVFRPGGAWERATGTSPRGIARGRRTELELIAEVLLCLDRGITQTSAILRRANITYGRLAVILAQLEDRGLIAPLETDGRTTYEIEAKGRLLLNEFLSFRSLLERTYGFTL